MIFKSRLFRTARTSGGAGSVFNQGHLAHHLSRTAHGQRHFLCPAVFDHLKVAIQHDIKCVGQAALLEQHMAGRQCDLLAMRDQPVKRLVGQLGE